MFYLDESTVMVTTATEEGTNENTAVEEKKKKQPEGTVEYTVQDRDTVEKIAAHFDTTPSELKKINKLISAVIFPGQVIYIPDKNYVPRKSTSSVSSEDSSSQHQTDSVFGSPQDKPKMDVPLVRSGNSSPSKVPGHVERQPSSSPTAFDFEVVAPHKLSEDEVQQLDQDCMERFIKLKVKHITDGQTEKQAHNLGVVKGTLLVTPNAVMFDPDVSDPLVLEHGSDKYGMIAPMEMIISAAMYHDIAAMKLRGKRQEDGTVFPKPEVYHDKSCPMAKEKLLSSQKEEQSRYSSSSLTENLKNILRNPLNKSESVCSCGKGVNNETIDLLDEDETDDTSGLNKEMDKGRQDEVETVDDTKDGVDSRNDNVFGDDSGEMETKDNILAGAVGGEDVKTSPRLNGRGQKKLSVSFSLPETDSVFLTSKEKIPPGLVTLSDSEESDQSKNDIEVKANIESGTEQKDDSVEKSDKTKSENENSSTEDKETRIGNILYLPVEEDANGEVTVQSVEKTANSISQLSANHFAEISKSDTDLVDASLNVESKDVEKTRSSSTSSLGPFSPTPHLSAFVNYATGFFQRHASDNSIKDIKDVIVDSLSDLRMPESKLDSKDTKTETKPDIPTVSAAPTGRRRGKMSRHGNTASGGVAVESAVTMDEKPDLLTMDYDKFAPRKSQAYPDPPLYLCLRLGTPQNKNVFHNYSIESYGKRRKKPEYWFSIPREKVDHLYAFFVQWTPEIYGDEEEITPEKRGFVVIDDNDSEDLEMLDEHFGPNSSFQKDWEFVHKETAEEIISQSEAIKRRSIVFDEPIPLPELIGESTILTEAHISELSQELPGRTVGYPWTLIYSTDKHGFSLKTLYRDMVGLDSPILIAVKDTNDNVFGAMTSCELKYSDSFYGTGETFLFTFYPEFKVFHWTGDNNFFIKGNQESLSIGAGQGVYGLWFDEDLYHGRTNKCETFDNDILTSTEDFVVKGVEAWAFIWE